MENNKIVSKSETRPSIEHSQTDHKVNNGHRQGANK